MISVSVERGFSLLLLLALALLLGGLLVVYIRTLTARLSRGETALLGALRALSLLLLLSLILNPTVVSESRGRPSPSVVVLLDTSASMSLREAGHSRLSQAVDLLTGGTDPLLPDLLRRGEVAIYSFGRSVSALSQGEIALTRAEGPSSALLPALTAVLSRSAETPAALLVLSDGALPDAGEAGALLRSARVPLYAWPVGDPRAFRDLALGTLSVPALAFRDRPVTVGVTLFASGFPGETVPVILERGGRVVSTQSVLLRGAEEERRLTFSLTPHEVGEQTYSITVASREGEALTTNNRLRFVLDVHRDKIRVLTVSGSPSWNYRFLRRALKRDPSVDLVSFVILREGSDVVDVPESELSLIPFPVDALFREEVKNFDILLFDNFSFREFLTWAHLEELKQFVERGGGFGMLGGVRSFGEGGYAETPVSDLLPVRITPQQGGGAGPAVSLRLTPEGERHPISRLSADLTETRRMWEELLPPDRYNRVQGGQGTVLVEAAPGVPLVAAGQFGKGRAFALATDEAWRWSLPQAGRQGDTLLYLRFVSRMVRWLSSDPELNPVRIAPPEKEGQVGEVTTLRVRLLGADYLPLREGSPTRAASVTLTDPEGRREALPLLPSPDPGEFLVSFTGTREGAYTVEVTLTVGGAPVRGKRVLTLSGVGAEFESAAPRPDLLRRLAEETGGGVISDPKRLRAALQAAIRAREAAGPAVTMEERHPLGASPVLFGVVVLLLAAEWLLRRRWGLA